MRNNKFIAGVLMAALLAVAGCAGQKEPATQAVTAAEAALAAVAADAGKYVPDDLRTAEAAVASLRDAFVKGDYKAVVAGAPALMTSLSSLKDAASGKKAESEAAAAAAMTEWGTLSADLPKMVAAIQSRVDTLSASKKLPKALTQESFDAAKTGLAMINRTWAEASAAAAAGSAVDAVAKAKMVKEKGAEVLAFLGMTAG
jgi:hypothetical protein